MYQILLSHITESQEYESLTIDSIMVFPVSKCITMTESTMERMQRFMAYYPYKERPLTPKIFSELVVNEMFHINDPEQLQTISEVAPNVLKIHTSCGGKPPNQTLDSVARQSFKKLRETRIVELVDQYWGYYRFLPQEQGLRAEGVYGYYYPREHELATLKGEETWLIKVGQSKNIDNRVLQQVTAMHQKPTYFTIKETDQPQAWESLIHLILVLKGRYSDDSPGKEWYSTNIEELEQIVRSIDALVSL